MAEQIERDGMKFWKFGNLPFDVGEKVRAIYNFYMRTNPETGAFAADEWAVYPNNSTPRTIGPLLKMLRKLTDLNGAALAHHPGFPPWDRMKEDHALWSTRLAFYEAKQQELFAIDPNQAVGITGNAVSTEMATYIVEPLFLGWFPNEVEPFASQPGVFSNQDARSVMDLYQPFTMANQVAIVNQNIDDAYAAFKQDLKDNAAKVFTEHIPLLPALKVLPFVVLAALGLGIFVAVKD
jgi:hypothetical protein